MKLITDKERAMARSRECLAVAEAVKDTDRRYAEGMRAAAAAWAAIAGCGVEWSLKPLRQQLDTLKTDTVAAIKAVASEPPKAPPPAAAPLKLAGFTATGPELRRIRQAKPESADWQAVPTGGGNIDF